MSRLYNLSAFARRLQAATAAPRPAVYAILILTGYVGAYVGLVRVSAALGGELWSPAPALSVWLTMALGRRFAPALLIPPLLTAGLLIPAPAGLAPLALRVVAEAAACGAAGLLLRGRWRIAPGLPRRRDILLLLGSGAFAAPLATAAGAVAALASEGMAPGAAWSLLVTHAAASIVGCATLLPFLVTSVTPLVSRPAGTPEIDENTLGPTVGRLETLSQGGAIVAAIWLAFRSPVADDLHLFYVCIPPLIWIALRHSLRRVTAVVLAAVAGMMLSVREVGDWYGGLLDLQLFTLTLTLTMLILSSVVEEQRRAVRRLRAGEAELRQVLDQLPVMVDAYLPGPRFVFWNRECERVTGYSAGEVIGASDVLERLCPDASYRERMRAESARRGQPYRDVEWDVVCKDGSRRVIAWSSISGPILDGSEVRWAVGVDVTERRRSEARLHFLAEAGATLVTSLDYQATLRSVAHLALPTIADWCFIDLLVDGDLRRVAVAHADPAMVAAAEELQRRYPVHQKNQHGPIQVVALGHTHLLSVIPDDVLVQVAEDEEHLALMRRLGLRSMVNAPLTARGRVIGAITVAMSESGRRYTAEDVPHVEDLARRAAAAVDNARLFSELRRSEERYRAVLEQAVDGIVITDFRGRTLEVNAQLASLLGTTREAMIGQRMALWIAPDDLPEAYRLLARVQAGERISFSLRLVREDGEPVPVEMSAGLVNGEMILAIVRDVSERLRLEAQLRQAHRLEVVGTFANGIAHDFNNILAAIVGFAELALIGLEDDDSRRHEVEQIARAARRGSALTRQLLSFSRSTPVELRPTDLPLVIMDTIQMLRPTIDDSVTIRYAPEPLWRVPADVGQLQQVLMNLLVNARDALTGGGTISVLTANVPPGDTDLLCSLPDATGRFVRVTVADDGEGMDEATLGRVFDPFFTTKEQGKGTGLGMAIVHGIVRNHGGAVTIRSVVGCGTEVTVYLPVDSGVRSRESGDEGAVLDGWSEEFEAERQTPRGGERSTLDL